MDIQHLKSSGLPLFVAAPTSYACPAGTSTHVSRKDTVRRRRRRRPMSMDHPDSMEDLSLWPEFPDPDSAFIDLFGEDAVVNASRHSTNFGSQVLQDDFVLKPTLTHRELGPGYQTQKSFTPIPAVRPTISTHQPEYVSSGSDGLSYAPDQGLTISPSTVEDYDNIFLTPPQEQNAVFSSGFGARPSAISQLKTPSLDSCTTYATQTSFPSHDVDHTHDQGFPWTAGFSASNLGNLASTLHAGSNRSSLDFCDTASRKRPSVDLGDTESRNKRSKKITNGYPCAFDGCPKHFNRECDSRKHFKNVHADKVHGCKLCGKALTYPKDVTRHMKQIHGIDVPAPEASAPQVERKPRRRFSSLKSVVSMLAKLQLWSAKDPTESEEAEHHILVTRDQINFRIVCLKGIESSEALMREIGSVFGVHLGHSDELRRYGSGGTLGRHIAGSQLMAAVHKARTAGKTLKVSLTTTHDTRNV